MVVEKADEMAVQLVVLMEFLEAVLWAVLKDYKSADRKVVW